MQEVEERFFLVFPSSFIILGVGQSLSGYELNVSTLNSIYIVLSQPVALLGYMYVVDMFFCISKFAIKGLVVPLIFF